VRSNNNNNNNNSISSSSLEWVSSMRRCVPFGGGGAAAAGNGVVVVVVDISRFCPRFSVVENRSMCLWLLPKRRRNGGRAARLLAALPQFCARRDSRRSRAVNIYENKVVVPKDFAVGPEAAAASASAAAARLRDGCSLVRFSDGTVGSARVVGRSVSYRTHFPWQWIVVVRLSRGLVGRGVCAIESGRRSLDAGPSSVL
jgi:hypothetical protein